MSTGGVFVESSMILQEDTELTVKFKLPDSDTIIVAKVRVAWTNGPDSLKKTALPFGMGLQFLDLSSENMSAIRTYLDKGAFVPTW
jgi:Tfp pilus assembly protein PilZ